MELKISFGHFSHRIRFVTEFLPQCKWTIWLDQESNSDVHACSCLFKPVQVSIQSGLRISMPAMPVHVYSSLFMPVYACSCVFIPVHACSCFFMLVHACSYLHTYECSWLFLTVLACSCMVHACPCLFILGHFCSFLFMPVQALSSPSKPYFDYIVTMVSSGECQRYTRAVIQIPPRLSSVSYNVHKGFNSFLS